MNYCCYVLFLLSFSVPQMLGQETEHSPELTELLKHLHRNTRSIKEALDKKAFFGIVVQWKFVVPYETFNPISGGLSITYPVKIPFSLLKNDEKFSDYFDHKNHNRFKREAREERTNIYQNLENLLDKSNLPGKSCLLRTICEAAEIPFEDDFSGEILNIILQPSSVGRTEHPEEDHYFNNYIEAEINGIEHGNCHQIYSNCTVSVFDSIPGMHHEIIHSSY